ncbi:MAG: hypothetical protein ACM30E_12695 [Nitrososphaerales archaeon]
MGRLRLNASGAAEVLQTETGARLVVHRGHKQLYSNAQIDDYSGLPRSQFRHTPPLTLGLRARFSHEPASAGQPGLQGTAGFGFWNDPFMMTDPRPPMLPRALWFFCASPPSDMKLDLDTPGCGWKAATIDALRPSVVGPALAAPLLIPLMNIPAVYRRAWPPVQRRLRIAEAPVPGRMTDWHSYAIEWERDLARFLVDGSPVLMAPAPRGRLGLVIWCDNQYMIVKPWGRLGYGLLETGEQWLEVEDIDLR